MSRSRHTGAKSKWGIAIAFMVIFLAVVAGDAWLGMRHVQQRTREDMGKSLEVVAASTRELLTAWLSDEMHTLQRWCHDARVVSLVEQQRDVPRTRDALLASPALSELQSRYDQVGWGPSTLGFSIVSPDGITLASSLEDRVDAGAYLADENQDSIARAFAGETVFVPPLRMDDRGPDRPAGLEQAAAVMLLMAPVTNAEGQVIAVVGVGMDPVREFTRLCQGGRIGQTGETYAFDREGWIVSASRFQEELVRMGLVQEGHAGALAFRICDPGRDLRTGDGPIDPIDRLPLTRMAAAAVTGQAGVDVEGYRDYRGVRVLGAWEWDETMGLGIATEIDEYEALAIYREDRRIVVAILSVTVALACLLTGFLLWSGTRANKLLEAARDEWERVAAERTADLAEAEERSRTLLESAGEGIFGTDTEGRMTFVNPAALQLLQYEEGELLGRSAHDIIHHSHADGRPYPMEECPMCRAYTQGQDSAVADEVLWRKDGTQIPVHYSSTPLRKDGAPAGAVITFSDISARKAVEAELHSARDAADAANRAKSDFLANMSHEIRTPMNAILGMTRLALQTELSPKQEDYLHKTHQAAEALLGIINDILDFSKIEANKLEMESIEFNLEEVVDGVASLVSEKSQEKGLELLLRVEPNVPGTLRGDPLRLAQVLTNLVNNAVKFTREGEIVIATELESQHEDEVVVRFSVRDTGVGLTPAQAESLFQPFTQADTTTTRTHGGTGLGLSICKRLTEMMGGRIWVDSEPGVGSTFTFTARFGLDAAKAWLPVTRVHPDLRGLRMLIVDDNATSREILEEMLLAMGFEVLLAPSGPEGLDKLAGAAPDQPIDLVLMDWNMPGMDGFEAVAAIRGDADRYGSPRIIMVTAYGLDEVIRRAEDTALDGFLLKPVNPSTLLDTFMQAFGKESTDKVRALRKGPRPENLRRIRGADVLLVEDNAINRQVATEILQQEGLVVHTAINGQEAVDAVAARTFDAILMDVQMPVLDGYQATRVIRDREATRSPDAQHPLPIIAMTAHAMAGDEEKSLAAGMNDHITKPVDPDRLFGALVQWITPREGIGGPAHAEAKCSATAPALPAELPGIDIADGLRHSGGNPDLYRRMLLSFRSEYAAAADQLGRGLTEQRIEASAHLVHTLKGIAGTVGAKGLQEAALKLEHAIQSDATDEHTALVHRVSTTLDTVMEGLQSLAQPADVPVGKTDDQPVAQRDEVLALLDELETHLRTRKPKPCKDAITQLCALNLPEEFAAACTSVDKLIRTYKLKEALTQVTALRTEP